MQYINADPVRMREFGAAATRFKREISAQCEALRDATETLASSIDGENMRAIRAITGQIESIAESAAPLFDKLNGAVCIYADYIEKAKRIASGGAASGASSSSSAVSGGTPAVQTVASIQSWIKEINPKYDKFSFRKKAYRTNCGSCSLAVYKRLNGIDSGAAASHVNIPTDAEMEQATGKTCCYMSVDEIGKRVMAMGAGACVVAGINRNNSAGHWFNIYYDGNKLYTIEGQSGNVYDWPHDYGDICDWCVLL